MIQAPDRRGQARPIGARTTTGYRVDGANPQILGAATPRLVTRHWRRGNAIAAVGVASKAPEETKTSGPAPVRARPPGQKPHPVQGWSRRFPAVGSIPAAPTV